MKKIFLTGCFKIFLPSFNKKASIILCDDKTNGLTSIALSFSYSKVVCTCNDFVTAKYSKKKVSDLYCKNVIIVVGDSSCLPFKTNSFDLCVNHKLLLSNYSIKDCINAFENIVGEMKRVTKFHGKFYISLILPNSSFSALVKKALLFAKILSASCCHSSKYMEFIFFYESFDKLFFLQRVPRKYLFKPNNFLFFVKRLIAGTNLGVLLGPKDPISFLDQVHDYIKKYTSYKIQKANRIRVGSGGSVIADFGSIIARIPMTEAAIVFAERNFTILEYAQTSRLHALIPKPVLLSTIDGHPFYCESKLEGVSLDLEKGVQNEQQLNAQYLDFLTSEFILSGRITPKKLFCIIDEPFALVEEYLNKRDKKLLQEAMAVVKKVIISDKIPLVIVHGDFKKSNFIIQHGNTCSQNLAIIDWECSLLPGIPFYDLLRYINHEILGLHDNSKNLVKNIWNSFINKKPLQLVVEYFNKLDIDINLLPALTFISIIYHINDYFDHETKNEKNWYDEMITDGLVVVMKEFVDLTKYNQKNQQHDA